MGWLAKLFRAVPKEEMAGIRLDTSRSYWEVDGPKTFAEMFCALRGWLSPGSVLYFEGGSPDTEIDDFMAAYSVPEQAHIAVGTIWPRPKIFHVPASQAALTKLAEIMERHAEPELAVHFHIYHGATVLLEWHDAFSQPILISGEVGEEQIKQFADTLGARYRKKSQS